MPGKATSFRNTSAEEPTSVGQSVGQKVSGAAGQVTSKVSDMGRSAANRIDENRGAAASGLEKAASALHDKAESLPGGEKVSSMAHATAEKLSSTADYVREHDVQGMMTDVETLVKNNPGPSLIAAAVVGFLVGRAFSSND